MKTSQKLNMALGQLYTNDIVNKRILQAMAEVPRENFVPPALRHCAYVDEDLAVGNGRFLMEPLTFAKLLDLADITPECRVLVVGALSGYAAAVAAKLASPVFATEIDPAYIDQMKTNFTKLGLSDRINIELVKSLADGFGTAAPFDVIIIMGAVDAIPGGIGEQLSLNGRLVAVKNIEKRPGITGGTGRGLLVKRLHTQLHYREHFDASCAILPGFESDSGFVF